MSADERDPIPSLRLGELRTFGVSCASESSDTQRLRIERIDVRDVKLLLGIEDRASGVRSSC